MGEKEFDDLKTETHLKKTALANHLTKLMEIPLIERPDHGIYRLKEDGRKVLAAINSAYLQTSLREKKEIREIQQRKLSKDFRSNFFRD
jgi:predicted transcriptional regulator